MSKNSEYIDAKVSKIGINSFGTEGLMVLRTSDNRDFPLTAFSIEVANYIQKFSRGDRTSTPSVYKMIEEIADTNSLFLREIEIYGMDDILRANLYFDGKKKNLTLKHYRASDAIALAVFYDANIKIKKDLLEQIV